MNDELTFSEPLIFRPARRLTLRERLITPCPELHNRDGRPVARLRPERGLAVRRLLGVVSYPIVGFFGGVTVLVTLLPR
jgi:hypothetical protein